MTNKISKFPKRVHKTPVKKIPKPAVDFDRDKNFTYLPQDESIDPISQIPVAVEEDIERMPSEPENLSETKGGFSEEKVNRSHTDI